MCNLRLSANLQYVAKYFKTKTACHIRGIYYVSLYSVHAVIIRAYGNFCKL